MAQKQVLIVGSAKLQEEIARWIAYWKTKGYEILDYPVPIANEVFEKEYPEVFNRFFTRLPQADVLFLMNEDKNGVTGYIGYESFAELVAAIVLKTVHNHPMEIKLLKMPAESSSCYEEISLWINRGVISLLT